MRVLLLHSIKQMLLLTHGRLEMFARDVLALAAPKHFYHGRERSHDMAFSFVVSASKKENLALNSLLTFESRRGSPVHELLMLVLEQEFGQRARVAQALDNAVHVASVAEVLEAGQAAFLRGEKHIVSTRESDEERRNKENQFRRP